jgi:hypothetical protein
MLFRHTITNVRQKLSSVNLYMYYSYYISVPYMFRSLGHHQRGNVYQHARKGFTLPRGPHMLVLSLKYA